MMRDLTWLERIYHAVIAGMDDPWDVVFWCGMTVTFALAVVHFVWGP